MPKTLVAIGDSITRGTFTGENDPYPCSIASPNFVEIIRRGLGYDNLINYGENGVSVSATSPTMPELAVCKRVDEFVNADTAVVAIGTNDFGNSVALGNNNDTTDISFYGALDILYRKLKIKYQTVYIITPIRRLNAEKNEKGFSLSDYRDAIKYKAKQYDFPVIDGYKIPIDPYDENERKRLILDGLHPNTEGHKLYADYVISVIKQLENERNPHK